MENGLWGVRRGAWSLAGRPVHRSRRGRVVPWVQEERSGVGKKNVEKKRERVRKSMPHVCFRIRTSQTLC